MIIDEDIYLAHYGTPRKSGRYPWGSGDNAPQSNMSFTDHVKYLKTQGLSDKEIANGYGMSIKEFRAVKSIERNAEKQATIDMVQRLKDKGMSVNAISKQTGYPEPTLRSWLKPGERDKTDTIQATASRLKKHVDEKKYLDVGSGVENWMGVSQQGLDTAVEVLKRQGYQTHNVKVYFAQTRHETIVKVLTPPGVTWGEVNANKEKISQVTDYTDDGGRTWYGLTPPLSVNPKRLAVKYDEDGGSLEDGVIYVRPNVKDLSLGKGRYAQVRILVNGDKYLKGMAIYKDDLPDGIDLVFNTNKSKAEYPNKLDVLKSIEPDPNNPFGAMVKQLYKEDAAGNPIKDEDGNYVLRSAANLVREEGRWADWSRTLASQVLSKQDPRLAKTQLDMYYEKRALEFDEIMALDNPVIKKKLLKSFADGADAASVHLKAAAIKGQAWHVILPVTNLPENQIYAPNYDNGEEVALIRYPHGGKFEIPKLIVNNNHPASKKLLGQAPDAVGINPKVAERLSGADFDGDTVLVIPNRGNKIKSEPALDGLKGFDPKRAFPKYEGMKVMSNTQREMGEISNLITDMTIKGASNEELVKAVRHSMVVIDAEKHELNYKASAEFNNIKTLKAKYQPKVDGKGGASTIVSRAKSDKRVPHRIPRRARDGGDIDPVTGERVFTETGEVNWRTGKPKTTKSTRLAEEKDARELSSGTPIENIYADHSNRMKAMANQARLEYLKTPSIKRNPSAAKAYANEVASLNVKLDLAKRNRPLERQANVLANSVVRMAKEEKPGMDDDERKKIERQALETMRRRVGKTKVEIELTDREWDAIQAGAISNHKLEEIIRDVDLDKVKERATPRTKVLMTSAKSARAQAMLASGATRAEVADALGVSLSTLDRSLSGSEGE